MNTPRVSIGSDGLADPISVTDLRFGFRAAFVIEIVEEGVPDAIRTHVFPLNPQAYSLSEPFASVLTSTEGGRVVAEETGYLIREIQIRGTFGFSEKAAPSFLGTGGREVGGVSQSGNMHFIALRNLFREYSNLKQDPTRGPKIEMIFHALKDDDHFVVVPRSFTTPRDARNNRVHYEYQISLAAIDASERRLKPKQDPFGLDDSLRLINEKFNDARAFFAEITSNLSTLKRKVGNLQAVMINVGGLLNAVGNFVRGAGDVIKFGLHQAVAIVDSLDRASEELANSLVDSTLGTLGSSLRSMRMLTNSIQVITAFGERFENSAEAAIERVKRDFTGERGLTKLDIELGTAGADTGSEVRVSRGSTSEFSFPEHNGVRSVVVLRGDTIASIAARYQVPSELLVIINDLRPPYITDGGGPGILAPGDSILIPVFGSAYSDAELSPSPSSEYLTPDEALYGRDLALDLSVLENEQQFDVKPDLARGGFDAETVTGLNNVIQGVRIIIETERGETVYIPDLGIRRTVGIRGTVRHVVLAALNLRTAVLQDPRIDSIQDSNVVLDGDVLQQEITPIIKGQRDQVTLVLPLGKASG